MRVTPAILPHSFEELLEKLSRIDGVSQSVQIDICDGVFGREHTWIPQGGEVLPSQFVYEYDVMANDWRPIVRAALALSAKRVVLHVDSMTEDDVREGVSMIVEAGAVPGIAVSNDESVETHAQMIEVAQSVSQDVFIQVMGIEKIGEQGQIFDDHAPERIVHLKQRFGTLSIQVDGAMNPTNAPKVLEAGADTLVVGSYIFGEHDPREAIVSMNCVA